MLEYIQRQLFSDGKTISSTVAMINGNFRVAGEIMVMSIFQGAPALLFINPDVYRFITKQALKIGMLKQRTKRVLKRYFATKTCF